MINGSAGVAVRKLWKKEASIEFKTHYSAPFNRSLNETLKKLFCRFK